MEENLNKLNIKVNVLIALVIVSLILNVILLGGGTTKDVSGINDDSETNTQYDVSLFEEISASDISSFDKSETYVVYIGRENCGWCVKMLPNLKQAQKDYKYTTKYIDIAKIIDYETNTVIDKNSYTILSNLDTVDSEKDVMQELGATPMMLIIKNNKIIASQVEYSEYETFAKLLEKAGLKK